ncbi:FtsX-like permease family protein [Kitasatospora sp. NPDC059646]|uniref:FtsX-like permease family protein n=1 Tax=Kitasatospora sp. NPDC059646 TaxID=3346893 RepID=UPI0036760E42
MIALLVAAGALALSTGSLVAVSAAYQGIENRSEQRNPRMAQDGAGNEPVALWAPGYDTVQGLQYSVVSIVPLRNDAPLPPGLDSWPLPGEAILSPALAKAGAEEGISTRLGRDAGRITDVGLSSPTERLAYVRPPSDLVDLDRMFPITGYGEEGQFFGDQLFNDSIGLFTLAITSLLLFPALVLLIVAARVGGEARDRRTALLETMGAGRGSRTLVNLGEAGVPALVGAVLGTGILATVAWTQVSLPFVNMPLPVADLRAASANLALTTVASAAAVLAGVTLLHRRQKKRRRATSGTRPEAQRRAPRWWPALLPVGLLTATRAPGLLAPQNPRLYLVVYAAGVLLTLATLPSAISLLMASTGRLLNRTAFRRGWTGTLVAGRWLTERPGVTARLVAGIVIAIGLIGQVQLHSSRIGQPMIAAKATAARIGTSVLVVQQPKDGTHSAAFLNALPDNVGAFSLQLLPGSGETKGTAVLQAPCPQVQQAMHLPCPESAQLLHRTDRDPRLSELVNWYGQQNSIILQKGAVPAESVPGGASYIVLMSYGGENLDVSDLTRLARQHLSLSPALSPPGGEWLTGALLKNSRGTWITLFGSCAVLFIGLAIGLNSLAEFVRFSRTVGPLGMLTGRRSLFASVAAWTLLAPLLVAALLGLLVDLWLSGPLTAPLVGAQISWTVLGWLLSIVAILAVGIWTAATWSAQRAAFTWLPEGD